MYALGRILWRGKWIILLVTVLAAGATAAWAVVTESWYRAEVVLLPADEGGGRGLSGELAALSAVVGMQGSSAGNIEPLAILRSKGFARDFILDEGIETVLMERVDSNGAVDIRDAVRYFDTKVRSVQVDRQTGLVTLAIEWVDPQKAADWANRLATRVNETSRGRSLAAAEANIAYLQDQLQSTNIVTLQQSIARLLESEMQKAMLARGNEEFAFRIIDSAFEPKRPSRPRRALAVIIAAALGAMLAIPAVLLMHAHRMRGGG